MSRGSSRKQKSEGTSNIRLPVKVREDTSGIPQDVLLGGQREQIASVVRHWDVSETLSGEKRLIKSYFEVITERGANLRLLCNQVTGSWYREDPAHEG